MLKARVIKMSQRKNLSQTAAQAPPRAQRPPLVGVALWALSCVACTSPAPEGVAEQKAQSQREQEAQERVSLDADARALSDPASLLSSLAARPAPLDEWEASDGWVAFFKGQLAVAAESFRDRLTATPADLSARLGAARAYLELAEAYSTAAALTDRVAVDWLSVERQSPHAALYAAWYDWVELAVSQGDLAAREALKGRLASLSTPEMAEWAQVALSADPGAAPSDASAEYRPWLAFARAVEQGEPAKARKLLERLKLRAPIFVARAGEGTPSQSVYDPRLARVAATYYALEAREVLGAEPLADPWAPLLSAQVSAALGDHAGALALLTPLDALTVAPSAHLLLLSPNLTLEDARAEARARRVSALYALGRDVEAEAVLSAWPDAPTLSTPQRVWRLWALASAARVHPERAPSLAAGLSDELKALLPTRRRPLARLAAEGVKGEAAQRLNSLELTERWLDAQHHRFAEAAVWLDLRVSALNALNAAEDPSAPLRLGGRNRLSRLSLSALNQIQLSRHRVASKYFLRLREDLPALATLAEMTGDVLSGSSFNGSGDVNAGQ